jgi:hypothetical protein
MLAGMKWGAAGILVSLGLAALATTPARADLIQGSTIQSGNWSGGAYDEKGQFSYCVVQSGYRSGITLYFSVSPNFTWRLAMSHPQWQLPLNQAVPVSLWVDQAGPYQLQARSVSAIVAAAELPATNDMFNLLRNGNRLAIRAQGTDYIFNLDGTNAALQELVNCVRRFAANAPPTAPAPSPPAPQVQPPTPQMPPPQVHPQPGTTPAGATLVQRADAQRVMASILARPEMTGFHILTPAEIQQRGNQVLTDSDSVWQDDAVLGTLRVLGSNLSVMPPLSIAESLIASDRTSCGQNKLQSGTPADERGTAVTRLFTVCERDNGASTAHYILVPRPDGTRYLFGAFGIVQRGAAFDRVRATDAGLRQAIFSVLNQ